MGAPVVFISYSHDSDKHKSWVLGLASGLRRLGVDVILDQWDLSLGQDAAAFMDKSIAAASRVLLICTEQYVEKAEKGAGGVGYERLIVSGELVARIDTKKFIPVVRQQCRPRRLPHCLGARLYIDFSADSEYDVKLEELVRELHGTPVVSKPPLGANPYTSTVPEQPQAARLTGPSGLTTAGIPVLQDEWFAQHAATAARGLEEIGREGAMELRSALHEPVSRSQLQLLNAVRRSTIPTFGWPIAVLLENHDEFRPKPTTEGIVAEVARAKESLGGEPSYDYWTVRSNGDLFLLKSLFEDERTTGALFFNTRIVRVTEALLFCANLYDNLGVGAEAYLSIRIGHHGLSRRTLRSSNPDRDVFPARSSEDRSEAQLTDTLAGLRLRLVDHVMQIVEPMFMLFDYTQLDRQVYDDIVNRFVAGQVT